MTASSLSISLAQLGQRGAKLMSVMPYGLPSPSSSRSGRGPLSSLAGALAALAGGLAGLAGALVGRGAWASKVAPQDLQRIFLPTTAGGALRSLSHSGQVMVMVVAMEDSLKEGRAGR